MENFDSSIQKVVNLFSHPLWFILQDDEAVCTCVDFTTKDPVPGCKYCFGTGKSITIARVNASHQNNTISLRGTGMGFSEKNVVGIYYTNQKTSIHEGDLIYDGGSIDVVQDVFTERSDSTSAVFYRIETAPLKSNVAITRKIIESTIKEAGF